jgi:hypothetical protein
MRALLAACAAFLLSGPALADFAIVTRDASIHEQPRAHSRVLAHVQQGDVVELVSRRSVSGYYEVRFSDDEDAETGYLYRTYFRARTGDPGFVSRKSGTGPSNEPDTTEVVAPSPTPGAGLEGDGSFDGCPLTGNVSPRASNHDATVELNRNKNRSDSPKKSDIDPGVTLSAMLAPGADTTRFKVGQAAQITGYVHDAKVGGVETANCKAKAQIDRDTHIELVIDPGDDGPTRRVIVEVTPRIRALVAKKGLDWSTEALQRDIIGQTITVTGWMIFDIEHTAQAENTAHGNPSNWRATCWEIHPVTDLQIGTQPIAAR